MKQIFKFAAIAVFLFAPAIAFAQDTASTITVHQPWIRATVASAPVAGGFAVLENTSDVDDRLIGGTSVIAGEVQVHEMSVTDGVMKMRQLADGLVIPAGESVELKPGSFHVMFMKLGQQMVAGEKAMVTLTFANAGDMVIEFDVLAMGSAPATMKMK